MSRSPEEKRGAGWSWRREVASVITVLALLGLSASPAAAQVLRNPPPTSYHFLRYDDVPSDENSPYWPNDFWSPLKFISLGDLPPGSYINFGGEDRERVEHFTTPLFGLTPRRTTTYDLHRLLFEATCISATAFEHSSSSATTRRHRPACRRGRRRSN